MLLRLSLLLKILVVSSAVIKAVNDEIKRFLKQTYLHYFQKKKKKRSAFMVAPNFEKDFNYFFIFY